MIKKEYNDNLGFYGKDEISISRNYKILVIDDSLERQEWFDKHLPFHFKLYSTERPDLEQYLRDEKFDLIFLDNDLGSTMEGWELLKWIPPTTSVIGITNNSVAGVKIANRPNSIWIMFGDFEIKIVDK